MGAGADGIQSAGSVQGAAQPGPAAELIFGDWYPALRSRQSAPRQDTALRLLLGVPLLLGRKSDGTLFAMRDLCPHRGIPLSAGWFDGENGAVQVPRLAASSRAQASAPRFLR